MARKESSTKFSHQGVRSQKRFCPGKREGTIRWSAHSTQESSTPTKSSIKVDFKKAGRRGSPFGLDNSFRSRPSSKMLLETPMHISDHGMGMRMLYLMHQEITRKPDGATNHSSLNEKVTIRNMVNSQRRGGIHKASNPRLDIQRLQRFHVKRPSSMKPQDLSQGTFDEQMLNSFLLMFAEGTKKEFRGKSISQEKQFTSHRHRRHSHFPKEKFEASLQV
ncbi:hypothetical protein CJ030_MR3G011003 [Morella rubra]|uniref:Uncharacterized protein n=1 Tax=Morella rubra TaxID=262757 RepID=A0A6A1W6F5_9ROSI|nr:hypothetical protein CJ030_MR3G011003 [Morella rubra]